MAVEPLPPLEVLEERRQELQLQHDWPGEEALQASFSTFKKDIQRAFLIFFEGFLMMFDAYLGLSAGSCGSFHARPSWMAWSPLFADLEGTAMPCVPWASLRKPQETPRLCQEAP